MKNNNNKKSSSSTANISVCLKANPNDKKYKISQYDAKLWDELDHYLFHEQALHVKSRGHFWDTTFGITELDPDYAPEKRVQFKLPYVKIPKTEITVFGDFPQSLMDDKFIYILVHPCYIDEHFYQYINQKGFTLVDADSPFVATPTSSYRTLTVIKVNGNNRDRSFEPCQIKLSVRGQAMGAQRELTPKETAYSFRVSNYIDELTRAGLLKNSSIEVMREKACAIAKLTNDCESPIQLNMLIRDLPKESHTAYYGFSSVFSTENIKANQNAPLIYQLAMNDIKLHSNLDRREALKLFLKESIVDAFLNSAVIYLKQGIAFEPHSQNLGIKVKNGKIVGFFIRDGYGFSTAQPFNDDNATITNDNKLKEEMILTVIKKRDYFNQDVIKSIALFFSFYVIQKLCKVFLKDNTYERLGVEATNLSHFKSKNKYAIQPGKYTVMAKDTTPYQSGHLDNRFGIQGPSSSSIEPLSIDRNKLSPDVKDLFLLPNDIDEIRRYIKVAWISAIEKNIGPLPPQALNILNEFKAIERGAKITNLKNNREETITPTIFDFATWLQTIQLENQSPTNDISEQIVRSRF